MKPEVIDPCLEKFRAKKVKHEKLDQCMKSLIQIAENPRPECIVVLTGPSGVGKSTILSALKKHLRSLFTEQMHTDPGFLPYLSIEAVTGMDGHYNWKDAFTRTLLKAGEILIDKKVLTKFETNLDGKSVFELHSLVREELRRALESLITFRQVPIFLIDEASAILRIKSGLKPLLQFEILKSLSVLLKIPIVLVGAYDLLGILDGNGQLIRRSDVIHFSRYLTHGKTGNVSDQQHFADVLCTFLEAMDVEKETNFLNHVDYFMLKSVGCVGNLKDWLDRALVQTIGSPTPLLTLDIIKLTALSNKSLIRLTGEALEGELKMADVPDDDLAKLSGLEYTPVLTLIDPVVKKDAGPKQKTPRGRVGLRGPSRDPVGGIRG